MIVDDKFVFLSILSEIDEEYIEQALMPWTDNHKRTFTYHLGRKVACLITVIGLSLCCIFHTQVKASVETLFTMIANILNISNDLRPYIDIIGTAIEKDGITLKLQEVILTENSVVVGIEVAPEEKTLGVEITSIKINGDDILLSSYSSTINDQNECVIEWKFTDSVMLARENDLEIEVIVHQELETSAYVPFTFSFTASNEELMNHTVYKEVNQYMDVSYSEITIEDFLVKDFMLNGIQSRITIESEADLTKDIQYYLIGKDSLGNEIYYSIVENNENEYIFRNEMGIPDINSEWIDMQLYAMELQYITYAIEESKISENTELSELYSLDEANMIIISEPLRIDLD